TSTDEDVEHESQKLLASSCRTSIFHQRCLRRPIIVATVARHARRKPGEGVVGSFQRGRCRAAQGLPPKELSESFGTLRSRNRNATRNWWFRRQEDRRVDTNQNRLADPGT